MDLQIYNQTSWGMHPQQCSAARTVCVWQLMKQATSWLRT